MGVAGAMKLLERIGRAVFGKRGPLWAGLLALATLAGCIPQAPAGREKPYLAGAQPGYPALGAAVPAGHTRYSPDSLADLFVRLTHDLEWGARRPTLVRYEGPVSVGLYGRSAAQYAAFVDTFLADLRTRAGIAINRRAAPHNLLIRFIPGQDFRARIPQHFCVVAPGRLPWATFREDPILYGTRAYERPQPEQAMTVYIPDNLEPYLVRQCLIEEIAQALGPANDLYGLGPSIFNDDNMHVRPTTLDFLMLRVLYQPEMRSGLSRAETRRAARAILARLNPQGQGAPPLPRLRTRQMAQWAEDIRQQDGDRLAARARAVTLARRIAPGSVYHCHSLMALARLQRRDPASTGATLDEALGVCTDAHGSADLRLALIRLERARATFKTGQPARALALTEGLETALAGHAQDERLVALYDLQAASLRAIQQGTRSFEARRRAGEWGAYALGRDHADVRRFLTQ